MLTKIAVGAILQATCFGLPQFLAGRLVAGFGLGIMTTVIPIWLTECANPKSRGRMMAMQLSNLIMGLILANWLDYGMATYSKFSPHDPHAPTHTNIFGTPVDS